MLETLLGACIAGNKSLAGQDRRQEPHSVGQKVFVRREGTSCCQPALKASLDVSA